MAKKTAPLLPATELRLQQFGKRLRLARLRRRLTGKQVAERAGMTPVTLRSLERGSSGVTMGAYLAVMQVLGAEGDLDLLLKDDPIGRDLQDASLTRSPRGVKRKATAIPRTTDSPPVQRALKKKEQATTTEWAADGNFISADSLASLIKPPVPNAKGRRQ
ncbi:helix-turn-helix transcriptional regulator [Dyella sp.]|jgi:transcriptional regulator with XRE-family HTH domain|uniref:helix-turn-helix domain-containing protein n=1 Tax=Dyella sp. TaxID=1869338 RepID=UPI002FD8CD42